MIASFQHRPQRPGLDKDNAYVIRLRATSAWAQSSSLAVLSAPGKPTNLSVAVGAWGAAGPRPTTRATAAAESPSTGYSADAAPPAPPATRARPPTPTRTSATISTARNPSTTRATSSGSGPSTSSGAPGAIGTRSVAGPEFPQPALGGSNPGQGWQEEQGRKLVSLQNARSLAVMTTFRLGMDYQEQVAALGLVTQIELAIIARFRESVPDPGQSWDSHRHMREIERRLARLRWVEGEQAKGFNGLKGVWNNVMGRRRVTGRELYERMIDQADAMLLAMQEDRSQDIMSEVERFTGAV